MTQMNPCFLAEIAQEFLRHGAELGTADSPDRGVSIVEKGISLLEKLLQKSPGFVNAQMALANAKYVTSDLDTAAKIANTVLGMDKSNAEAYLLLARIGLDREHYGAASSSLEEALSHDFSIRQRPVYHLIKAKILESSGDLNEAQSVLEGALKQYVRRDKTKDHAKISLHDQASLCIQLAQVRDCCTRTSTVSARRPSEYRA